MGREKGGGGDIRMRCDVNPEERSGGGELDISLIRNLKRWRERDRSRYPRPGRR